jgi:hypothetical protein
MPYAELLQELRRSPLSAYDEKFGAACNALLKAQRAGAEESVLQALAADLCGEVRHINIALADSQLKMILECKLL